MNLAAQEAEELAGGAGEFAGVEDAVGWEFGEGEGIWCVFVDVHVFFFFFGVFGVFVEEGGTGAGSVGGAVGFVFVGADEFDALEFVSARREGVWGWWLKGWVVVFGDGVGRAEGFCFVDGAHVLCEGVGAGKATVAFWVSL